MILSANEYVFDKTAAPVSQKPISRLPSIERMTPERVRAYLDSYDPETQSIQQGRVRRRVTPEWYEALLGKQNEAIGGTVNSPVPTTESPGTSSSARGVTQSPSPVGTQNLQQSIQTLKQAVDAFNQLFKQQHDIAEPALRQVYDALKRMSQISPDMPLVPEVNQGIQSLINTLNAASQDEQQDAQFMYQIGTQAQQLATMMGLSASDQQQFMRNRQTNPQALQGQPEQVEQPAIAPAPAPAPANPNKGSGWGGGVGRGIGNMVGNLMSAPGNVLRNLQRGYQRGRQFASNSLFVKTAESFV